MRRSSAGRSVVILVIVLTGVLLACKKKSPSASPAPSVAVDPDVEATNKLKPQVNAFFTQLGTIATKTRAEPRVKVDQPFPTKLDKSKYFVVGDSWLTEPQHIAGPKELQISTSVYSLCAYGKDKETLTPSEQDYAKECLAWEYVAVVRPRSITPAKAIGSTKTFIPGTFTGEMFLFDMKTAEIKGRYQMATTNSDKLTLVENASAQQVANNSKLDLAGNAIGLIHERMAQERKSMTR